MILKATDCELYHDLNYNRSPVTLGDMTEWVIRDHTWRIINSCPRYRREHWWWREEAPVLLILLINLTRTETELISWSTLAEKLII